MVERLDISRRTWDTKRKMFLEHLAQFYVIEVQGYGMSRRYCIKEQIADYEPYISPRNRKKMEQKYQEVILNEISKPGMELQLYSTMNDRVIATGKTKKFDHSNKTSYNYVNKSMKEMFGEEEGEWGTHGKYLNRVWAKQLFNANYDFERLNEAEERNWNKIVKKNMATDYIEIYSMYEININEAMYESGWYKYQCAKQEFFEIYGFVPVRVKEYLVGPEEAKIHDGFVD